MSQHLVAVDWGTSALRAARVSADGKVLEERRDARGILTVPAGGFPQVLQAFCGDWLQQALLCLISGMAGSRQGWVEAPYCACPASAADIATHMRWIEPGRIAIVPGLSCESAGAPDVMRGEETQVLGALELLALTDATLVLPGTHSKWVRVVGRRITGFSTFMSGEFYALLKTHSILARTLPAEETELDAQAFLQGVARAAQSGNLLQTAFSVRSLALFDRMPPASLPSYLSGLVIGEELRAFAADDSVVLVGSPELTRRYSLALQSRGVAATALSGEATWQGLWRLSHSITSD